MLHLGSAELRVERQAQHLPAQPLAHGQRASGAELCVSRMFVHGSRIVDEGLDTSRGERRADGVPAANAHDEEVEDVPIRLGQLHARAGKQRGVQRGKLAPPFVPAVQERELRAKNGRLGDFGGCLLDAAIRP